MKLLLIILSLQFVTISCRPEQKVTDFNVLITAAVGEDINLQTDEDKDLLIEYSIDGAGQSVHLVMSLHKMPKHGILKDCVWPSETSVRCIYSPNKDFYGMDSIEFYTKDGDLEGSKTSKIFIDVKNTPDPPIAYNASYIVDAGEAFKFKFPKGFDSDSSQKELKFVIENAPDQGKITNCKKRSCVYTSPEYFEGIENITYKIIDEEGASSNLATIIFNVNTSVRIGSETFIQGVSTVKGVDLVWVIDNSHSMKNEQEDLKDNFESFIDNFLSNGVPKFPFDMAITTTDIWKKVASNKNPFEADSKGRQYDLGSSRAGSDFNGFKKDFKKAVMVGIGGSPSEKVFSSMEAAHSMKPNWYKGDDHLLAYIVLSDESEQSGGKVNDWVSKFQSFKDKPEKVKIFNIVGKSDSKGRYKKASKLTETKVYNLSQDFSTVLDDISLTVTNDIKTFYLNPNTQIDASSVSVTINGAPINDFIYSNHTIQLGEVPPVHSIIVVTYEYSK